MSNGNLLWTLFTPGLASGVCFALEMGIDRCERGLQLARRYVRPAGSYGRAETLLESPQNVSGPRRLI